MPARLVIDFVTPRNQEAITAASPQALAHTGAASDVRTVSSAGRGRTLPLAPLGALLLATGVILLGARRLLAGR